MISINIQYFDMCYLIYVCDFVFVCMCIYMFVIMNKTILYVQYTHLCICICMYVCTCVYFCMYVGDIYMLLVSRVIV